ncbi:thioredoxin-like domain-containing protein [Dysgonomonas reticulitermitis]
MKTTFLTKLAVFSIIILLASCKDKGPHFTIEGKIAKADTTMLYLERRSLNETVVLDSVKLDGEGHFKFEEPALGYPEFYILKMENQAINLAVDSTESITVYATKPAFASEYTIEGSEGSVKIKDVVLSQHKLSLEIADLKKKYEAKEITQDQYVSGVQESVNEYKSKAKALILSDYQSLASYFALFQKVDGLLIFDPYDKSDLVAFRAVATIWDQFKSKSPRAEHLKNFTLSTLAELKRAESQNETLKKIESSQPMDNKDYYEILLPDIKNNIKSLSSMKGKVVILDFTAYQTEFSPAHNILINDVYSKNKGTVDVYQISFDTDVHAWKNAATNLPWTCVRDDKYLNSPLLTKFNVQGLPTIFLLNKNGEIVRRILATDNLAAEVKKLL